MTDEKKGYPVYDHDQDGHAAPDIEPGRVFFDEAKKRVVCSEHGDKCATDGSATREVTSAPFLGTDPETGIALFDQENQTHVGDARLYRCTVCGQGTWSHEA